MSAPAALPSQARLRRPAEFAALRHAPGRHDTRFFLIRYTAGAAPQARLGIAVSRRVSTRAVERNRIKRTIREAFRHARAELPLLDLLLIARTQAAKAPNAQLRADLDGAWPRLKPLKPHAATGTIAR